LAALEQRPSALMAATDVLVIVCGGAGATVEQLQAWDREG
jgi:L-serine/L-threonine ammonia-lyase